MKFGQVIEYDKRYIFFLQGIHFCSKIMQKMRQEDWFQIYFYFFKKALYEVKASLSAAKLKYILIV